MRHLSRSRLLLAVALLCCPLGLVLGQAQVQLTRLQPTEAFLKEASTTDWYGVYFQGKKIGYAKTVLSKVMAGGEAIYQHSTSLKGKLKAQGKSIELDILEQIDFDAKAPYALRGGKLLQQLNNDKQVTSLTRTAHGFEVSTLVKGGTDKQAVGKIDYTLGDHLTGALWVRQNPKVGDTISVLSFAFDKLKTEVEKHKVLTVRESRVKGVPMTYYEIEVKAPTSTMIERLDSKGNMLSGVVGGAFELRLEPEQQAKSLDQEADLFVMGLVKMDKGIGDPDTVKSLEVELMGKQAAAIESGPWQKVTKTADGKFVCKVGKSHGQKVKATEKAIADNLEATLAYPSKHPKIIEMAKKAVGDAKTPTDKVKNLVKFVHNYIAPSFGGKGMVVLDLIEKKQGDCTAYAALFTTLARAAGIPTREVSGFAYMGDEQKSFGGHAWNEVVLDGHWHPIDATTGAFEVDAARISLGSDQEGGNTFLKDYGSLSLRLIEVKHAK